LAEISHPPAAYERTDVPPWLVGALAAGFCATVALVISGLLLIYPSARPEAHPAPPAIPAPRLQPDPAADLAAYRARMAERDGFRWVDRAAGRIQLPIAEAMREQVRRGWPMERRE
jgi:hypothetical protein